MSSASVALWEAGLSAIMSRLRRLLSAKPLRDCGIALNGRLGQYQFALPTDAWIDLEAGVSALDRAEGFVRAGDFRSVLGPATVAAAIASRPFLPGMDGEWVHAQRRKLERQRLRGLDCLTKMWLAQAEPALAVETAALAVALDAFREAAYQLLMRAYASDGNRAEAAKTYKSLETVLRTELSAQPAEDTRLLYLQLMGQAA